MGALQSTEKKSPSKTVKEEAKTSKTTPEKGGDDVPRMSVSPPKTPVQVTEEEMASVEAATTKIRDSLGGTSLEIVLSPAIKKVKYHLFPQSSFSGLLAQF